MTHLPFRRRLAVIAAAALLAAGSASAFDLTWPVVKPPRFVPPAADTLMTITAGMSHTCATRFDGGVLCWGNNAVGALGLQRSDWCSTFACALQPSRITVDVNGKTFASARVSAGADHTCALDAAGQAFCWGNNSNSQTGVPSLAQVWQPTPVAAGKTFQAIGSGVQSTCVVEPSSTWCWGKFGDGTLNGPTWWPVAVPYSGNMQAVAVGYYHACMQTNIWGYNDLLCLGQNHWGQTSHNPLDPSEGVTITVPWGTRFGRPVGPASTRVTFTCADRISDGTVVCAGQNVYGMLGDGSNKDSWDPRLVGGGAKLAQVSAGWTHACAIDPQQQAWCWGDNYFGQLGNGSRSNSSLPVLVGGGAVKFRAIAAGHQHSCGIGTDNAIYCWGNNDRAQLGRGYLGSYDWTPRSAAPAKS